MNERIRELAEQATRKYDRLGNDIPFAQPDLELFAELIVRECLKIVEPDQISGDEWCVTLDETAQSIRQHFGLELKNEHSFSKPAV